MLNLWRLNAFTPTEKFKATNRWKKLRQSFNLSIVIIFPAQISTLTPPTIIAQRDDTWERVVLGKVLGTGNWWQQILSTCYWYLTIGTGNWILRSRYWLLGTDKLSVITDYLLLVTEYLLLITEYLLLITEYLLLVTGYLVVGTAYCVHGTD